MKWPKTLNKSEMSILKKEWKLMGGRAYDRDNPLRPYLDLPYWRVIFGRHEDIYGAEYELVVNGGWELKFEAKKYTSALA